MLILISVLISIILISGNTLSSIQVSSSENILIEDHVKSSIILQAKEDINQVKILYPLSSIPALVENNDCLKINFESDIVDRVFAYITTAFEPVVDEIWLEFNGIINKNSYWETMFLIPNNTPEELYNLTIIVEKNNQFFSNSHPRSVSIYNEIDDDFTIVHIADFHVGDPRGLTVNVDETIGFKSIKRCINEINLIHPDLVIISGDLVFGQLYPFEYSVEYKKCYELIQLFDVPTFLIPGNHDGYNRFKEDGLEFWKNYFGPLYYSFDFGNFHFIGVNSFDWPANHRISISFIALNWGGSIQDEQLNWIEEDLESTNANLTFMFLHHNPIWDTKKDSLLRMGYKNRNKLLSLIDEKNVDMVLAGHVHRDTVNNRYGTIFITTTTPASDIRKKDGYWGYRLIKVENGNIVSYNYKEPRYSIPTYKLKIEYTDTFNAKIKNELEMDIQILSKFNVPPGEYEVQNGYITMIRGNSFMQEIYVEAEVSAQSNLEIELIPIY